MRYDGALGTRRKYRLVRRQHRRGSRALGGRPDLAGHRLDDVRAPTLLIVGGLDAVVLDLNRAAQRRLRCPTELVVIPGATHLFEEPGTLAAAARAASGWFSRYLRPLTHTNRASPGAG